MTRDFSQRRRAPSRGATCTTRSPTRRCCSRRLIFPLFFFVAFAGGLSSVGNVPGFDFPSGYTAFQFVFVLLQSAAFGGVFTGFAIAADFESGFARRLLLAAPRRGGILVGLRAGRGWRAGSFTAALVTVARSLAGMHVDGGGVDLVGARLARAAGQHHRDALGRRRGACASRTMQAGPAMQMPVFLILFLAPVYVPLNLLRGWIHAVASLQPAHRAARIGPRPHLRRARHGRARLPRGRRSRRTRAVLGADRTSARRARAVMRGVCCALRE